MTCQDTPFIDYSTVQQDVKMLYIFVPRLIHVTFFKDPWASPRTVAIGIAIHSFVD